MNIVKRLSQPSTEPVSLSDMKAQLNIKDTVQDAVITRRITEAREWIEAFLQRALITSNWQLVMDEWPGSAELLFPPVASVSSVKYIDANNVLQTLSSSAYYLDNYREPAMLHSAYGYDFPDALAVPNAVRVEYVAGYANAAAVPSPIKEALMLLVGHWMNYQGDAESGSVITRVPLAVEQLLQPYRILKG